ncbi:Ependymin [Merluccius polli]|uniref:Ependymin n=1 Tax=Merluccius polli TaxID=89951 RepID=A0AA47NY75_MERPO|nr:Ependymin [Merluccius polli]
MNVLNLLCILSLVLLSAAAQKPKPCHAPPLMNGRFTLMDSSGLFPHSTGEISYDAFGQRMLIRTLDSNANFTTTDLLMHFNQKVYYVVDWNDFTCQKRPLDTSFTPIQVPPGAKLMGQVIMGSSSSWGMGMLVNTWIGFLPTGMYMTVFSEIGCIPITMSSNTTEGWATVSTFNWVLGNTDPMDFIPPPFCARAQLDLTEKPDTFFTALKSLPQETKAEN